MSIHPSPRIYSEEADKWAALLIVAGIALLVVSACYILGWAGGFAALGLISLLSGVAGMVEQEIKWKLGIHSSWCERRFDDLSRDMLMQADIANLKRFFIQELKISQEAVVPLLDGHPGLLIVCRLESNLIRAKAAFASIGIDADYQVIQSVFGGKRWRKIIVMPPDFSVAEIQSSYTIKTYQEFLLDLKLHLAPNGSLYLL